MNSPIILSVTIGSNSLFEPSVSIERNKTIATASLIKLYPKTIEKTLSYFSLINVRAATESDAQIVAENSKILLVLS